MSATARDLQKFLDSLEPDILRAFNETVELMRARSNIRELEQAIDTINYMAAYRASGVSETAWSRLTESVRQSYVTSGRFIIGKDVPARFGMDFNIENPRVRDWLADHSSRLIVEIDTSQRAAIRQAISAGFEQGRNPRSIALDIVGRVSPQTGRRTGGVLGLHEQFSSYATNMRNDLTTLDGRYFSKTRRDKRFDGIVQRAIDSGQPLPSRKIDQLVNAYERRLLQTRGTTVARTESLSTMNAAIDEAMNQVIDEGLASADAIIETWDASMDSTTRPDHAAVNGTSTTHGGIFIVGGHEMRYPGDPLAPIEQTANCRCVVVRQIDFSRAGLQS